MEPQVAQLGVGAAIAGLAFTALFVLGADYDRQRSLWWILFCASL